MKIRLLTLLAVVLLVALFLGQVMTPSTPTSIAIATASVSLTPTARTKETVFSLLIEPFVKEASLRRKKSSGYPRFADPKLNHDRLNFLVFGYGETYEPPWPVTEIGSPTVISLDFRRSKVAVISLTHDLRAPEVERIRGISGRKGSAVKLDQAYLDPKVGGFGLLQEVVASATGLWPDFQIAISDVTLLELVDLVGGIEIEVPADFVVLPYYLNGKEYGEGHFAQGRQWLNGQRAIQFLKAVQKEPYRPELENNLRKEMVIESLAGAISERGLDPVFWGQVLVLHQKWWIVDGKLVYDFDPSLLFLRNVSDLAFNLTVLVARGEIKGVGLPAIVAKMYIVDPGASPDKKDTGVHWVLLETKDPFMQADLAAGVYPPGSAFEVPRNANPYGDLVNEYWLPVRAAVRRLLEDH